MISYDQAILRNEDLLTWDAQRSPPNPQSGGAGVQSPSIGGFGGRPLGKLASCKVVQNTGYSIHDPKLFGRLSYESRTYSHH